MPSNRFALIVASSKYDDERLSQLRAPASDAHALGEVLRDPDIGNYQLKSLINQQAHMATEEIEGFFKDRASDDQLLLYFSCHGIKNDRGRLYFGATNTRLDRLASTGISSEFVAERLYECRARKIILILDCCYSGAFTRGLTHRADEQVRVDDLAGRGRAILFASSATEYAFEIDGSDIQGSGVPSIFTRAIVHGLLTGEADRDGDGQVSIDDLYEHVLNQVRQITPNQTPGRLIDTYGPLFVARSATDKVGLGPLSPDIRAALSSPLTGVRKGVIEELEPLLKDDTEAMRNAARAALLQLSNDDSDRVVSAAASALGVEVAEGEIEHSATGESHEKPAQRSSTSGHANAVRPIEMAPPGPKASKAELAHWAETMQFSTTRLAPGYDEEDVDVFLDAIRDTFLNLREPPLTPDEIRNVRFTTTRLRPGYDEEEVDAFLDEVELRLAALPEPPL